jgi:hypothetical protein
MGDFALTPFDGYGSRFARFREWIEKATVWKWKARPRWGGMEARNLDLLLKEMPELTEQQFCIALRNLLNYDDVHAMQRPGY